MRVVATLLILTPALFAQAIVEHAVAAAAGSAAGVAGKRVSESLDKALAVVNKAAAKTAEPAPVEAPGPKVTGQRVPAPEPGANLAPAAPAPAAPARRTPQPARPRDQGAKNRLTEWELTAQAVTEPPPADVPADQLRQIEMGMARDAVLAKLGIPVSRISIPDEGGMLEIYQYQAHGEPSGSIRLLNGNVTAVRAN